MKQRILVLALRAILAVVVARIVPKAGRHRHVREARRVLLEQQFRVLLVCQLVPAPGGRLHLDLGHLALPQRFVRRVEARKLRPHRDGLGFRGTWGTTRHVAVAVAEDGNLVASGLVVGLLLEDGGLVLAWDGGLVGGGSAAAARACRRAAGGGRVVCGGLFLAG